MEYLNHVLSKPVFFKPMPSSGSQGTPKKPQDSSSGGPVHPNDLHLSNPQFDSTELCLSPSDMGIWDHVRPELTKFRELWFTHDPTPSRKPRASGGLASQGTTDREPLPSKGSLPKASGAALAASAVGSQAQGKSVAMPPHLTVYGGFSGKNLLGKDEGRN